jgi:hypothetical protein
MRSCKIIKIIQYWARQEEDRMASSKESVAKPCVGAEMELRTRAVAAGTGTDLDVLQVSDHQNWCPSCDELLRTAQEIVVLKSWMQN